MKWFASSAVKGGVLLLGHALLMSSMGCSKKHDDKAQAEKSEAARKKPDGDRYADGERLAAALRDWSKRWSDTADLPGCEPLLKDTAELELCKTAMTSLASMKTAAAKPEPESVLLHDAAELAFTTEAASEKLRNASMEKLQSAPKAAPSSSASGAAKASPPASAKPLAIYSAKPSARAMGPGIAKLSDGVRPLDAAVTAVDPAMQVMQAYSRVNRAALRYLSQFLQFGPLKTRKAAFAELDGLAKRRETWPALSRTLREAAMVENDTELQGQLKALAPKLSRRPPSVAPALPSTPEPAP